MSTKLYRQRLRRGTAATAPTEQLRAGEMGAETDVERVRISFDGLTDREDCVSMLQRVETMVLAANQLLLGDGVRPDRVKTSAALRSDGAGGLVVGLEGTTEGSVKFENATASGGSVTLKPVTGTLGTRVQRLPARDGQVGIGSLFDQRDAKTGAYTVVLADRGKLIDATSGTWTLALDPAATLGAHFMFGVFNSGSGAITIDADGSETIRDAVSAATTKVLAQGEGAIMFCDGTGWGMLKVVAPATAITLATLGGILHTRVALTGAYTVVPADKGKIFEVTSGTFDLALDPAATLADNHTFAVFNTGSGVVTVNPNGAETIRDAVSSATTKTLSQGEGAIVICNGTSFLMLKLATPTTLSSLGAMINGRSAKTGAYTVVPADKGKIIEATSGTWTLALDPAATLGDGFACVLSNVGSGVITVDANSTETIRDFAGSATTKTLAQGESGILYCDGTGFFLVKTAVPASAVTLASLGGLINGRSGKTGAYTIVAGDKGKLIDATSGTWTLSLDPAATLTDGFTVAVFNSGSGVITIDPDGSETIRDATSSATTKTLAQGEGGIIVCDGSGFLFLKVAAGGGAGTGDVLIASGTLGAAAATIDITSIPNTYSALKLVLITRATNAANSSSLYCRCNGDTTAANYLGQVMTAQGGGVGGGENGGSTAAIIAVSTNGANALANSFGQHEITFVNYASTTLLKTCDLVGGHFMGTGSGFYINTKYFGMWRSTSAINQLTVFLSAGNLEAGSRYWLYGVA